MVPDPELTALWLYFFVRSPYSLVLMYFLFSPKIILGGLILNLGLSFLEEWLFDTWTKLKRNDYFVIVIILIVIAAVGFLEGIMIGLLMSIVLLF
ncbi:MAG: hypothetical protein CM1200mP10_12250 [Candidatus Neomarinimicrobiota bacterium]|nr:MAG: hypothetical protein CM1200mP10_12250 [Candidatus Neomarinimicrobiota bacterium]